MIDIDQYTGVYQTYEQNYLCNNNKLVLIYVYNSISFYARIAAHLLDAEHLPTHTHKHTCKTQKKRGKMSIAFVEN